MITKEILIEKIDECITESDTNEDIAYLKAIKNEIQKNGIKIDIISYFNSRGYGAQIQENGIIFNHSVYLRLLVSDIISFEFSPPSDPYVQPIKIGFDYFSNQKVNLCNKLKGLVTKEELLNHPDFLKKKKKYVSGRKSRLKKYSGFGDETEVVLALARFFKNKYIGIAGSLLDIINLIENDKLYRIDWIVNNKRIINEISSINSNDFDYNKLLKYHKLGYLEPVVYFVAHNNKIKNLITEEDIKKAVRLVNVQDILE